MGRLKLYPVGSNASTYCCSGCHDKCRGIQGKHEKSYCTCRCHGPRGYTPPDDARMGRMLDAYFEKGSK